MPKSMDLLSKKLEEACKVHPKVEIRRKTGFSGSQIDRYIERKSVPTLDNLDVIAKALGVAPWELIKPDNALPTPAPVTPTLQDLFKVIEGQEKRIADLEAQLKGTPIPLRAADPELQKLVDIVAQIKSEQDRENIFMLAQHHLEYQQMQEEDEKEAKQTSKKKDKVSV